MACEDVSSMHLENVSYCISHKRSERHAVELIVAGLASHHARQENAACGESVPTLNPAPITTPPCWPAFESGSGI
jgi:hypothetical protein